jgi:hypothetical protein
MKKVVKRLKHVYKLADNEHLVNRHIDQDSVNIVAYALHDGSGHYHCRYNRIVTGEHLKPFGVRGSSCWVVRD